MQTTRDVKLCGILFLSFASAELLPSTELVSNCYNFPQDNFDFANCVKCIYGSSPHLMRDTGASAIDFTLHDVEGQAWNLHEVLEGSDGKPVALIWGMSTCPAYQGLDSQGSSYRWAYWDEYDLVRRDTPVYTKSGTTWLFLSLFTASPIYSRIVHQLRRTC